MDTIDRIIFEHTRRIEWWLGGPEIHCIPSNLFVKMPTERIVELYNVEMSFFRPRNLNTVKPITEENYLSTCKHKNITEIGYCLGYNGRLYDGFCLDCEKYVYARTGKRVVKWNCDRNETFED